MGKELFDWYMRSVKFMPYDGDDVLTLAQRELERNLAFYALERHRNRDLPELTFPKTREEYHDRMAKMDAEVREFLVKDGFMTVPDYIPTDWQEMGFNALWLVRDGGPNFWESVLYRDPNPDHWHAVIPGHRFDGMVAQKSTHPIRRYVSDPGRSEGWALYLGGGAGAARLLRALQAAARPGVHLRVRHLPRRTNHCGRAHAAQRDERAGDCRLLEEVDARGSTTTSRAWTRRSIAVARRATG